MTKMEIRKAATLADFKAKYDPATVVPNKIRAALAEIAKQGPEHHVQEVEFAKMAGVSLSQISSFRAMFEKHIVVTRNDRRNEVKIWFGDAKVAAKARGE